MLDYEHGGLCLCEVTYDGEPISRIEREWQEVSKSIGVSL